jgi:hypothetical protein
MQEVSRMGGAPCVAAPNGVGTLRANSLVFIKAGQNFENEVESYRVIWGRILNPRDRGNQDAVWPQFHACGDFCNTSPSVIR